MDDLTLFDTLREDLAQGSRVVLCTVVGSMGSDPRGAGARMALRADGSALGTVGGGSAERLATERAKALLAGEGTPGLVEYTMGGADSNTGMVCGGAATVCFQLLTPDDLPALDKLSELLTQGSPCTLALDCTGDVPRLLVFGEEELPSSLSDRPVDRPILADGVYTEPMGLDGVLYLFGAGHVGQALGPLLAQVGFRVVVVDSRPELARPELFPGVHQVLLGSFDRIGDTVSLTPRDYAVVMTPGHMADLEVLCQVLSCSPCYVGCMGSRKKLAFVRQELERRGFSPAQIEAVHLPIGLPLGGETPMEIAVSVAAELIQFRAARLPGRKSGRCPS